MHILIVNCTVKQDYIDDFIAATMENASNSRKEPGVVRFDFVQQTDDPTKFGLIEVYRSAEGLAAHREAPHYKVWAEKAPDMLAEPRTRNFYRNIDPPDEEW
ncbi:Antibiotic biosynthesis monooxygenase [Candidatus Sulfopaludibacter sp. SbA3]|nr:Antibiotic biosynthesis monooxygenase [Candidatus Sulfopaludibacter sp. SbA3]